MQNIPVLTSAGGKAESYNDPNSPESIMKKTKEIQVQSMVDTKYDVKESAYDKKENFKNWQSTKLNSQPLLHFAAVIFFTLASYKILKKYV
jgi:hypothetical protein